MGDFLRYLFEYTINIIVCAVMCYLPMKNRLAISMKKLFVIAVPSLVIFISAGAFLSAFFNIIVNTIIFAAVPLFFFAYYKTVKAGLSECIFLFMYVSSLESYPFLYAIVFDAVRNPNGSYTALSVGSLVFQSVIFLFIFIIYFFSRKKLEWLTENFRTKSTKRFFWLIPTIYLFIAVMIIPINYSNLLYRGRSIILFLLIITALFVSETAMICFFYMISREIICNEELLCRNQLLEVQARQYEILRDYMEHTRRLRHDFRQQILTMNTLAESGDFGKLSKYLSEYSADSFGIKHVRFCENSSVDALVGYYFQQADSKGIKTDWKINLPEQLSIPEPTLCGMLGNLIENAIDGCRTVNESERIIHLSVETRGSSMIVFVIENPYDGAIKPGKNGLPLSTKHERNGVGLESVKAVADKYRGKMELDYNDKTFSVNVLLNLRSNE